MSKIKVNYRFDDLSKVGTADLKKVLGGYKLLIAKGNGGDAVHEAYMRIETELLHRKELVVD